LKGGQVKDVPMSFIESLLQIIAEPNIAYVLLSLGTLGLMMELYHPGSIFPGVTGAICLLLGFASLGTLPVGWAGVGLLVLAVALLLAELHAPGFGAFGVGALIAFILGSLLMFVPVTPASPAAPRVGVSLWLIGTMAVLFGGTLLLVGQRVWAAQRLAIRTGSGALVGRTAEVVSRLEPRGTVRIGGEAWSARSDGGTVEAGTSVLVERVDGIVLVVRPPGEEAETQS
jgi:membrane-bound serine protease (ClpP class)